jgi:hypothetical protein
VRRSSPDSTLATIALALFPLLSLYLHTSHFHTIMHTPLGLDLRADIQAAVMAISVSTQ